MTQTLTARVKWFDVTKGYGFVVLLTSPQQQLPPEIFFHVSAVNGNIPKRNDQVHIIVTNTEKGIEVTQLHIIHQHKTYHNDSIVQDIQNIKQQMIQSQQFRDMTRKFFRLIEENTPSRNVIRGIVFETVQHVDRHCSINRDFVSEHLAQLQDFYQTILIADWDFSTHQMRSIEKMLTDLDEIWLLNEEKQDILHPSKMEHIANVLDKRIWDIILVLDGVSNAGNRSAILRSAEAFGIQRVWIVFPDRSSKSISSSVTRKAHQWLSIRRFDESKECIQALTDENFLICTTELHNELSISLDDTERLGQLTTRPLAVVIGSEESGVSSVMSQSADFSVYLSMYGFVESLNVSVAAALVLSKVCDIHEWRGSVPESEREKLRDRWCCTMLQ